GDPRFVASHPRGEHRSSARGRPAPRYRAGFGDLRALVRGRGGGDVISWVRFPASRANGWRLRHDTPRGSDLWARAFEQSECDGARRGQHGRLGNSARVRLLEKRSIVASHRPSLRLERGLAFVRREAQRVYNGTNWIRAALERGESLERRRLRTGRESFHD